MEGNSLLNLSTPPNLVAIGDKIFLIYHVTSRDHVPKWLCDFMGEVSYSKSPMLKFLIVSQHFAKFCDHRPCGTSDSINEDIMILVCHVISQDHVIKG